MRSRPPFALTKWYFDCVAADGRAVIGYWASLAWRGVALTWQNVSLYEAGRPPVVRSSLTSEPPPRVDGNRIIWNSPSLACSARIEARQVPIEERLLDCDAGVVDWRGDLPRTWVFVDGIKVPAAIVTDEGIRAGGMTIALGERRTLHARRFAEIAAAIPPLSAVVPKSILALRETKWFSAGTLQDGNAAAQAGSAIHELAVLR